MPDKEILFTIIIIICSVILSSYWSKLDRINPRASMILNVILVIIVMFSILNLFFRII